MYSCRISWSQRAADDLRNWTRGYFKTKKKNEKKNSSPGVVFLMWRFRAPRCSLFKKDLQLLFDFRGGDSAFLMFLFLAQRLQMFPLPQLLQLFLLLPKILKVLPELLFMLFGEVLLLLLKVLHEDLLLQLVLLFQLKDLLLQQSFGSFPLFRHYNILELAVARHCNNTHTQRTAK